MVDSQSVVGQSGLPLENSSNLEDHVACVLRGVAWGVGLSAFVAAYALSWLPFI